MGENNEIISLLVEKPKKQDENKIKPDIEINSLLKENKKKHESFTSNFISLNNVKSSYTLKRVLSFLYEKKRLNLIIYNKKIKRKLGINIDKYKSISGKIIIGERNGNGIEYKLGINNTIIFNGEYLNGKKNGKGKEYYENKKIKFEGEYLNGYKIQGTGHNEKCDVIFELDKNGKGKEYYSNVKIKFEGEYIYEKKWNGKGYNKNGNVEFKIKYGKGYVK